MAEAKRKLTLRPILIAAALWADRHAQDLIEYALMAGFVAVSAGALMPGVAASISTIFSKVGSVLSTAQGGQTGGGSGGGG